MITTTDSEITRPAIRLLMAMLISAVLTGCASDAVIDYDQAVRFGQYSSYYFEGRDDENVQSLDASRIEKVLKRELEKEGFTRADKNDQADLMVRYRIDEQRRVESYGPRFGLGFGFGHHPFRIGGTHHGFTRAREIREGELVVELVDPQRQQVIWQGRARRNLTESMGPNERAQLIERVVRAMFDRYPPQPLE